MRRRILLNGLSLVTIGSGIGWGASASANVATPGAGEWSYGGQSGPDRWGDLGAEYATCQLGNQQSPIDLKEAIQAQLPEMILQYQPIPLKILNNGHTIQINSGPGNGLTLNGSRFELVQFHFHHPSEHTLAGKPYPLELHFVHRHASGQLAVLGVFLESGVENSALQPIWKAMPDRAGSEQLIADTTVDLARLLPTSQQRYEYWGSLTTPPCSEIVHWVVLQEPISISPRQIKRFAQLFPHNARPVVSLNRRFLLHSS